MNSTPIPHHTPDVDLIQDTSYRVCDCVLATTFCACLIVGLPGNCLALTHFLQSKKRNLSTLLYIVACSIDLISSVIHLPVAISLLNSRQAGVMDNGVFCSVWYFILLSVQLMSMYVVMLLSVSRAFVIVFPFYRVNKKAALISIPVYFIYQAVWTGLSYLVSYNSYVTSVGFCQRVFSKEGLIKTLYHVNYNISTGFPPILVLLSFLASVIKLRKNTDNSLIGSDDRENVSSRNNRNASWAIMYFAAVFLLCNSFTFVNTVLYTVSGVVYNDYPGQLYSTTFMFFYSWPISEILCTVLNATLNPLLYFWRMSEVRLRVKSWGDRFFGSFGG